MAIKVWHYPKCSTCRKALKWLDAKGVAYDKADITTDTPSRAALGELFERSGLEIKRFFNTSGMSYRNGGFKDRLPEMSDAEALDALAADGKLIKRPLVDTGDAVLIGFKEPEWVAAFDGA